MKNNYRNFSEFLHFNSLNHTQIWLAFDDRHHKKVLIKQLKQGYNDTQFNQFYQEYRIYQRLNPIAKLAKHFFPTLLDFYIEDNSHFLVIEFFDGKNLKQLIAENTLPFSQKIPLILQLCQAIDTFHSLQLIHRDIKPSNILVIQHQVKLLDFGLTETMDKSPIASHFTTGTPAYMSPEQFTGREVTYQSDYYSYGLVIYELLLGEKVFSATTLEQWAMVHCQMPIPTVSLFHPTQNLILQKIFYALLAKLPANRVTNLCEIQLALKKLQEY